MDAKSEFARAIVNEKQSVESTLRQHITLLEEKGKRINDDVNKKEEEITRKTQQIEALSDENT